MLGLDFSWPHILAPLAYRQALRYFSSRDSEIQMRALSFCSRACCLIPGFPPQMKQMMMHLISTHSTCFNINDFVIDTLYDNDAYVPSPLMLNYVVYIYGDRTFRFRW